MNYIQKCMVCKGKWRYSFEEDISKEELEKKILSLIRASCSPCGHQGLFTLEEEKCQEQKAQVEN